MEKMVMLTEEEYEEMMYEKKRLIATCFRLKEERDNARRGCEFEKEHAKLLWKALNRPAIEESAEKGKIEFYDWCSEKAEEYEKKDECSWFASRARFYNNGIDKFCIEHAIKEQDVEEERKYLDLINYVWPEEETEGWTSLDGRYGCNLRMKDNTWILSAAIDEAEERYRETNDHKYWDLWLKIYDMREESEEAIKDDKFGGFYR